MIYRYIDSIHTFKLMSTLTKPLSTLLLVLFLFLISICILNNNHPSSLVYYKPGLASKHQDIIDPYFQDAAISEKVTMLPRTTTTTTTFSRRRISGPGSSPPRCNWKCGRCTPCKPVHVPVPPGTPVTAEYYPEAWRCKCGNRLYMP